jgi:hypothetical protein
MRFSLFLVILVGLFIAACRPSEPANADLTISLSISPEPSEVGEAEVVVQVSDAQGNPVTDATVSIRGDMTHAGMQPVLRGTSEHDGGGIYRLPYEWTMAGDWFVEVTVTRPDGSSATQTFEYEVGS